MNDIVIQFLPSNKFPEGAALTLAGPGVIGAGFALPRVPAPTGRTGRRSAFPGLRAALPGGVGAETCAILELGSTPSRPAVRGGAGVNAVTGRTGRRSRAAGTIWPVGVPARGCIFTATGLVYFDRSATMSVAERCGSGGMRRRPGAGSRCPPAAKLTRLSVSAFPNPR